MSDPGFRTLVLDTEGLAAVARRDKGVQGLLDAAQRADARVLVPWTVIAESLHGRGRKEREHALSKLALVELTESHYRDAATLMDATGMRGHTVDALVASAARSCPRPVVLVTSDPSDFQRLLQDTKGIAVVAI